MWDASLPVYDGSFEHNLIVLILYARLVLFYIGVIFGIFVMLIPVIASIATAYFGIKSLKIKIKHKKHHETISFEQNQEKNYLSRLENNLQKKKKKPKS